jgi:hypothetical protein
MKKISNQKEIYESREFRLTGSLLTPRWYARTFSIGGQLLMLVNISCRS